MTQKISMRKIVISIQNEDQSDYCELTIPTNAENNNQVLTKLGDLFRCSYIDPDGFRLPDQTRHDEDMTALSDVLGIPKHSIVGGLYHPQQTSNRSYVDGLLVAI